MNNQKQIIVTYIIYNGGTGVRQAVANTHLRFMDWLYKNGQEEQFPFHIIVPAMDQANPDLSRLEDIIADEKTLLGLDQDINVIRLCDRIGQSHPGQGQDNNTRQSRFGDLDNPIIRDNLFLPPDIDMNEFGHGYVSNTSMGAVAARLAFETVFEDEEDSNGFLKIIENVINSNLNQVVHVILCGSSLFGGEGKMHTEILPFLLHSHCVEKLVSSGRMTKDKAEQHVRDHLLIDGIMHGGYFRFPALEKDKDVKHLVKETLANFDPSSAEHVHSFYLIEHELTCVLAEKPSEYGEQFRHAHAAELVAYDMTRKCIRGPGMEKQCVIPHYAVAGPQTNWSTLGVSDETHRMLISFLRFYAVLEYFLKPQLGTCLSDISGQDLFNSRIVALYYGAYGKKLRESRTREDLEKEILIPFWTMYRRAGMIAGWIYEISVTGKDWQTGDCVLAEQYTSLFNVDELERLVYPKGDLPRINQFQLDTLSKCREGNLASTGRTLDDVILQLGASIPKGRRSFVDVMKEIYNIVRI